MNPASSRARLNEDISPFMRSVDYEAQKRVVLVEWINTLVPNACLPVKSSNGELRASLLDGLLLCHLLSKLKPNFLNQGTDPGKSLERLKRFLAAVAEMGLPGFEISDVEKGSMKPVLDCLYALKEKYMPNFVGSKFACSPYSPLSTESQSGVFHSGHNKSNEVFQKKQGFCLDVPVMRISEMVKSNSLDNAPTQSLLSVVNGILDESIERRNTEIPQRVACLLRKVVQEIERRLATQAEHLRVQNNLFKGREEKYQSRIRVLEALATGTSEESEMVMNELQRLKAEKKKLEQKKTSEDTYTSLGKKEMDQFESKISALKQDEVMSKKSLEQRFPEPEKTRIVNEDSMVTQLKKERDEIELQLSALKQDLEMSKKALEQRFIEPEQMKVGQDDSVIAQLKKEKDEIKHQLSTLKQELDKYKKMYEQSRMEMEHPKSNQGKEVVVVENDIGQSDPEMSRLKQELEMEKNTYKQRCVDMEGQMMSIGDEGITRLMKEKDECQLEIATLKQELETLKMEYEQRCLDTDHQRDNQVPHLRNEIDQEDPEISRLKQELESVKRSYEQRCQYMENQKDHEEKQVAKFENDHEVSRLKQELESAKRSYEQRCQDLEKRCLEMERQNGNEEQQVAHVKNETDENHPEISRLKQELESTKRSYEQQWQEIEQRKNIKDEEELSRLTKLKDESDVEISTLKQELETYKKAYESRCQELEMGTKLVKTKLEQELKEQEQLLEDAMNKMKEIQENANLNSNALMRKDHVFRNFISNHGTALKELRSCSESTKMELVKAQKSYLQELSRTGETFKGLAATAEKYHEVLYENRKIYNELQDLKGNIRVYCRIRPFIKGQTKKDTVIDSIGEYGELSIINPSKGKETQKSFKFNKVFAPTSTQEEVFTDTRPLVRTILDGFNVCIFAYGQTGSGKTYTMTGPEGASKQEWGVNYRALDDLFHISEQRKTQFRYVIGVQMVEIYNEQILDLLTSDNSQKKLGVLTGSQPNGLAVPDASMHTVESTSDVIKLMSLGHANRTVSSTAMNERSSRSHSVVTIHVQGTDLKSGATTHASLHLVDLAGSERIDRSEVTGDRLREAQHINKSLSALGDVIFALAAKSNHVPYRNSKLTQVLQSSLGGRAKTLMFVQLNPDVTSYSETLSTLKFAERVSGVELGAARNNRDGKDSSSSKELMDQVESLKYMIAKKDDEIERLQLQKDPRSTNSGLPSKHSTNSLANNGSQSPTSTDHGDFIDRNSDSSSAQLTDNDERLSEGSDGDSLVETDADGTLETKETPKPSSKTSNNAQGNSDKTRMGKLVSPRSRVAPATPTSRLSQVKTTVRAATALKKAGTETSSSGPPARPSTIASSSPRTPSTPSRRLG